MADSQSDKQKYFDDDGNEINPAFVPKPSLCISCVKDDDPSEEILCTLNRLDQQDENDFHCEAYAPKKDK